MGEVINHHHTCVKMRVRVVYTRRHNFKDYYKSHFHFLVGAFCFLLKFPVSIDKHGNLKMQLEIETTRD